VIDDSRRAPHRYYRRLPDGSRILAVCRAEDAVWHAHLIRPDGWVIDWSYASTLAAALNDLAGTPRSAVST